jgi:chromatin assembly factor 1 subunit B
MNSQTCLGRPLFYQRKPQVNQAFFTRSPDGQCLILSSRDGYCTLIIFDDILPAYHTQQHTLQLQSIAQHHAVPLTYSNSSQHITPASTPASANVSLPSYAHLANSKKREPPLTAVGSAQGVETKTSSTETARPSTTETLITKNQDVFDQEPPKKKRRVFLTRVGELDS